VRHGHCDAGGVRTLPAVAASTLGFALLGLLARGPRTGYELSQALRRPIGYFWTASHSQIYPELARLEAARYVSHTVIDGPGPRDTKRYAITAAGHRALAAWAGTPATPAPSRDEFLLKVYSLWLVEPVRARALIEEQLARHQAQVAHYERLDREMRDMYGPSLSDPTTPQFSAYATLRRGLSFERHAGDWCAWLAGELR
jgi:DNA-binding PadR family transcriptional regulator